jgi:NIMA (never in mitosis gene a)-related kinase
MQNFEKIGNLGKGSFAEVFLVRYKENDKMYAMKQISLGKIPISEQESALNEVRILASIQHPNIIDFKESFIDEKEKTLNIIMEYASDKDILSKIKYYKLMSKHISENIIWEYLIQMIFGLKVLHDRKIIHRDLKSANVFLSGNIIKIGDFNISKIIKNNMLISSQTGTPYYASPEVWSERPYDYRTDIWSMGCIIYELCTFKPPFLGMTAEELYKNILKGIYMILIIFILIIFIFFSKYKIKIYFYSI